MTTTPADDGDTFLGEQPGVERLYDNVQARCSGITLAIVKMELWNTIEDFAIRSTCWRQTLNWTLGIGASSISFNPVDADTLVCNVMAVTGLSDYYVDPPATLIDRCAPTGVRSGSVIVSTKPSSFAANMPEDLFGNRFQTVLDGTLSRLFALPAKPWTSEKLAQFHGRKYASAINAAHGAAEGRHSNQAGWRFPYFAGNERGR